MHGKRVASISESVEFYTETLGFYVSDYYPNAGYFLRCREVGPHHQLFLLQHPKGNSGLNHIAFMAGQDDKHIHDQRLNVPLDLSVTYQAARGTPRAWLTGPAAAG